MTLRHAIGSFRLFGLRGCLDYLKQIRHRSSESAKWQQYLLFSNQSKSTRGITVIGTLSGASSLSKVLRDFCINLRRAGIPYQAFDTGCKRPIPDAEYKSLLTQLNEFKLNRYSDIVGMNVLPPLPKTNCRLSRICYWEFESGLCEAHPEFAEPGTVIANSQFNACAFRKQLPSYIHIINILYPFQFLATELQPRETIRAKYGIGNSDFMVFFNFDFCSGYYRKNPEGAVRAFAQSIATHTDTKLVFKTMSSNRRPDLAIRLKTTIDQVGIKDKVIFVDHFIPQEDLVGLTNACDVYLSLHRGEGFGLGIAEAMSLGKPVVVTNYSAPTEFCNAQNAILIPYEMIPVKDAERDVKAYQNVKAWANPDINAAATALEYLYNNREHARKLGENAKKSITEQFSIVNFKSSVEAFLNREQ